MAGKHHSTKVKLVLQTVDLLLLNVAFVVSSLITTGRVSFVAPQQIFPFLVIINLVWVMLAGYGNLYQIDRMIHIGRNIYQAIFLITLHYLAVAFLLYITNLFDYTTPELILFYFMVYYLIFSGKILMLQGIKMLRRKGFNRRNVVVLGGGRVGDEIKALLEADFSFGYRYLGTFDEKPNVCQFKTSVIGKLEDFKAFSRQQKVDVAFIALPDQSFALVTDLMEFCEANGIRVKIVPDFVRYIRNRIRLDFYGSIPIILLREEPLESLRNRLLKRGFDLAFSLLFIVLVLSWLIPLLATLIKLESKGPVFTLQRRTGLNNKEFNIIKFRTERANDPTKVTRLGSILRRTTIEEFPQFFNVLIGNMSIIGPRPQMPQHTAFYSEIIDSYMVRHLVKPGLTGWAQVNGYRGDTARPAQMRGRVKHDVTYIENWSVMLDVKIFFRSLYNLYKGQEVTV